MIKRNSIIILFLILFSGLIVSFNYSPNFSASNALINDKLKPSDSWDLPYKIFVDNNWSDTRDTYDWCYGFGTEEQPFIIENVTINGQGSGTCITVKNSNEFFIIRNCALYNSGTFDSGIELDSITNGLLMNNTCYDNMKGINLWFASNTTIFKNHLKNNAYGLVAVGDYINISKNLFESNTEDGILSSSFHKSRIHNNTFRNNDRAIYFQKTCTNVIISRNNMTNHSESAIELNDNSNHNIISENYFNNSYRGISVRIECINNTIKQNNISNSISVGIDLHGSNSVWNDGTEYNRVIGNNISSAQFTGICLYYKCNYNNITKNNISGCKTGVYIDHGGDLPKYNLFYMNYFKRNEIHAVDSGDNTYWNNTKVGNFWDNYTGSDLNDDGIGDVPYNITNYLGMNISQDYLPIWWDPPEIIINSPEPDKIFETSPSFNISIIEGIANITWYSLDGGNINITFTGLTGYVSQSEWNKKLEGSVFITFYVNDSKGYINSTEVQVIKEYDIPQITIISPSIGQAFGMDAPKFNITVEDRSTINATWYTIDGGLTNYTLTELTGTLNQTAWDKKGTEMITLTFYANDTLGHIGFNYVKIWKDITKPIITINSPISNQMCGITAPLFDVEITDPNFHKKWYALNGGLNITFTTETQIDQVEWDKFGNGTVLIIFYANNTVGNENSTQVMVRKDIYSPQIVINSPKPNEFFSEVAPAFVVSITDPNLHKMWYSIDGGLTNTSFTENESISQDIWDSVLDGIVILKFFANDTAGNRISKSVSIIKDTLSPSITILSPNNNAIYGIAPPYFELLIDDANLESTWFTIEGIQEIFYFSGFNGTIDETLWDTLEEGIINLTFYAKDTTGKLAFESVSITKELPTEEFPLTILIITIISAAGAVSVILITLGILRKRKFQN